jgi:hypothetical protein
MLKRLSAQFISALILCAAAFMPTMAEESQPAAYTNVAQGKYAWSSSSYPGGYGAQNAVDGDIDTSWSNGTYSGYQYWAVDLGGFYNIAEIQFYGRAGNGAERSNFTVRLSNTPSPTDAVTVHTVGAEAYPALEKQSIDLNVEIAYRFVFFVSSIESDGLLTLSEAVVLTADEILTERAGKNESLTSSGSWPGIDIAATVDGNVRSDWYTAGVSGTAYWQLDMGSDYKYYDLQSIYFDLTNRDGTLADPVQFEVLLSNDPNFANSKNNPTFVAHSNKSTVLSSPRHYNINLNGERKTVDAEGAAATEAFPNVAKAYRYLRITKTVAGNTSANALRIYEVSVKAKASTEITDISVGKTASASYTFSGENASIAYPVSATATNPWVSGSQGSMGTYWQVDLGEDYSRYNIQSVFFDVTKRDSSQTNLSFKVELSNSAAFSGGVLLVYSYSDRTNATPVPYKTVYLNESAETVTLDESGAVSVSKTAFPDGVKKYRYLRVTQFYTAGIKLYKARVNAVALNEADIALNKSVSAEQTWSEANSEKNPVNGVYTANWYPYSNVAAYWQVDFGEAYTNYDIKSVIFDATGRDSNQATVGFRIELSDSADFSGDKLLVYSYSANTAEGVSALPRNKTVYLNESAVTVGNGGTQTLSPFPAGIKQYRYLRVSVPVTGIKLYKVIVNAENIDRPAAAAPKADFAALYASSAGGGEITALPENGQFAVKIFLNNEKEIEAKRSYYVLAAGYSGSGLDSVFAKSVTVLPYENYDKFINAGLAPGSAYYKVYVWDKDTLAPADIGPLWLE